MIYSNQPLPQTSPISNTQVHTPLNSRQEDFCRSVKLKNDRLYKVISLFIASKDQELSLSEGEIIEYAGPDRFLSKCCTGTIQ